MFVPVNAHSVNVHTDIAAGHYKALCSEYVDAPTGRRLVFVEYVKDGASAPAACDLVLFDANGTVQFRDFIQLPNGAWRDSAGRTGANLQDLVSTEILGFTLSQRKKFSFQILGEGRG